MKRLRPRERPLKIVCCPIDSCTPAHLKLPRCPARSPLPIAALPSMSLSHSLHSICLFAHPCRSRPRGSILAPTLVTLPSMSLVPLAPFGWNGYSRFEATGSDPGLATGKRCGRPSSAMKRSLRARTIASFATPRLRAARFPHQSQRNSCIITGL
jgi:hypothetical protein